jgi:hypothetical protein
MSYDKYFKYNKDKKYNFHEYVMYNDNLYNGHLTHFKAPYSHQKKKKILNFVAENDFWCKKK